MTLYIEDVFGPNECYIVIRLDLETIRKLGLELTIWDIKKAIINAKKMKFKSEVSRFLVSKFMVGGGDLEQRYHQNLPSGLAYGKRGCLAGLATLHARTSESHRQSVTCV